MRPLIASAARPRRSNDMLLKFVELYHEATGMAIVEGAHMELAEPTISQAFDACVRRGARRVAGEGAFDCAHCGEPTKPSFCPYCDFHAPTGHRSGALLLLSGETHSGGHPAARRGSSGVASRVRRDGHAGRLTVRARLRAPQTAGGDLHAASNG